MGNNKYYYLRAIRDTGKNPSGYWTVGKLYPVNVEDMTIENDNGFKFSVGTSFEIFSGLYNDGKMYNVIRITTTEFEPVVKE